MLYNLVYQNLSNKKTKCLLVPSKNQASLGIIVSNFGLPWNPSVPYCHDVREVPGKAPNDGNLSDSC